MEQLTPQQLAAWVADPARPSPVLLDVREPWEFEKAHVAGSILIPMSTLPSRLAEIEALQESSASANQSIVCICHHGARSLQVAAFLEHQGLQDIANLTGGVHAWSQQVDPSMPTY